jgi:site-specific recombinase XerD
MLEWYRCGLPVNDLLPTLSVYMGHVHDAILAANNLSECSGRRDHVLLLTLYNTGARVSEITS